MGRTEGRSEPIGSGAESYGESPNVDPSSAAGHARISAAIGSGLIVGDEYSRKRSRLHRPVTTGQIIAAAIGSVSAVAILLGFLPFMYAMIIPEPFRYIGIPFVVCRPATTELENCVADDALHPFMPGDTVPFVVNRCVDDRFASGVRIAYTISRNLRNASNGSALILDPVGVDAPVGGCTSSVTLVHSLPNPLPDGLYYFEGVATVYGRYRTANSYFQTQVFYVKNPRPDDDTSP